MGKVAVVFPGQGSQSVGMLADVLAGEGLVKETFALASDVLGYDLLTLVSSGPEDQLNQTEFTQPALLTASIALWRLARERGLPQPDVVAGHSLGEYSALVAAEVLSFEDAVSLVQKRGQFMQSAVPVGKGGMAAILGLEDEKIIEICDACSTEDEVVQAANFNAKGQVVIAGGMGALNRAIEQCKEAGAKRAMPLAVSAPFHSRMMVPAAERMAAELEKVKFSAPGIALIQNVHADYESNPDSIRNNLVKQMSDAVLWTGSVNRMVADGVQSIIECGPGSVLSGLNKRINREIVSFNINGQSTLEKTLDQLS